MSNSRREEKQQERAIDKSIEETKDNVKKVFQQVGRELPEVTSTFHDYHEQNIRQIRDMTNTYLDSQKEVAKSLVSAATSTPLTNNVFTLIFAPWMHPQLMADNYVKAANNLAETAVSAARLSTDLIQVAMDQGKSSIEYAYANTKAVSQYMTDNARSFSESTSDRR